MKQTTEQKPEEKIDLGDEMNKKLKALLEMRPYGTATEAFLHTWRGTNRTPKSIRFPEGLEREVGYMHDGIITFRDGKASSATYERLLDYPSELKAIVVYSKINDPKICN